MSGCVKCELTGTAFQFHFDTPSYLFFLVFLFVMKKALVLILFSFLSLSINAQFNTDRLMITGRSALYYEDYVLSIQYFNQVLNAKPYLYEPWYLRGVAKFYLDDYVGAETDVTHAIGLNPYMSNMYELRGLCRIRQNNYDDAITDYTKLISLDPQNKGAWFNRALCNVESKQYELAQQQLDTMIVKWKKYANAYSLKAEVYLMQKDTTEAGRWLDKSLEIDPYDGSAWTTRAMIALSKRQWKDADTFLGKAIHLKPKSVNNYINRALARYNVNNLRGAMADYDTALDLDPNNFLAHYNRGLLRMQLGDDNRAIIDFDYVVKMEPHNVMALFNRAILLDKTGNLHAAIRDYSTVISQFPNFWTGLSRRANCYRRLGLTAKAELDEFRIMKAQMNKHQGIQPRWSKNKSKQMRKRSEVDPDKYNQIVVEDKQEVDHDYKSSYRGKVQNRNVELTLKPMYALSLFMYDNGVKSYHAFSAEVEAFNAQNANASQPIYVNCASRHLDELSSKTLLTRIDTLSQRIDNARGDLTLKHLLMERAVTYTAVQNLDAAISDLTAYLQLDSASALAYWQRAVCHALMGEFQLSQGTANVITEGKAFDDIRKAIELSPQNAYLYYDEANMCAARKDYEKALRLYDKAIQLNANMAEAYYNSGLVLQKCGRKAEAVTRLSKAGELGLYNAYSVIKQIGVENKQDGKDTKKK